MSASRKNLRKEGFRRYIVTGPRGTLAIDKDAPWRWYVHPCDWPRNGFFSQKFARLKHARKWAEQSVGCAVMAVPA